MIPVLLFSSCLRKLVYKMITLNVPALGSLILSIIFQFQTLVLRSKATNVTSSCLLHTTRTANVAMSKFDSTSPMPYEKLLKNLEIVKARLQRPLTLSEKILYSHLDDPHNQGELCTKSISALVLTRFLEFLSNL